MAEDPEPTGEKPISKKAEGQVTLTQMLKALDKEVAVGIEKKLKKLSKKKAVERPLDDHKAAQINRIEAYNDVTKELNKWDAVVDHNRRARHLIFPLDQEPDNLPSTADCIDAIKPRNDLEREVQEIIDENKASIIKEKETTQAEEKYQKAISADEAKERHKELQRMRIKLNTYGAKMRRQKGIKSKSYHRLLKSERLRNHMRKVESNKDALLDEIERLQRLRAQERASLKHKNTGKWAKHAKFRAKYDDEARKAMLEQIGIASKLLEKPAPIESDEDDDDDEDAEDLNESDEDENDNDSADEDPEEISEVSEQSSEDDEDGEEEEKEKAAKKKNDLVVDTNDRLIVSTELIEARAKKRKRRTSGSDDEATKTSGSGSSESDQDEDEVEEEQQRRLMSEAFANDDVVGEFQRAKDQLIDEEQPKDVDNFLPGWGDWAGPGIRVSKRKRQKFIVKAKKIKRQDETLGNVIISEKANETVKELQPKQLPRGYKSDKHMKRTLTRPTTATFLDETAHRDMIRPRIETRMGKRIEPIGERMLESSSKVGWA